MAHAKLSASGAKKWLNCPGSVLLEAEVADKSSSYADEGTTAHSLGEAKIRVGLKMLTKAKFHKVIKALEVDEDMSAYTDEYSDFVLERFNAAKGKNPNAVIMLEQRLDFSTWVPEGFGTGDAVIVDGDTIEIIDLKYGKGVWVGAEDNPQMKLYALGALSEFEFLYDLEKVVMTIYQPRMDNITTAILTTEELLQWANDDVKPKADKADAGTEEYICGKHCDDGFCKARPICSAYADSKLQMARFDFAQPAKLSDEAIAEILEQVDGLAKWANLVKEYALDQAVNHNVKYPGYKLVEGRSNRAWGVDETLVAGQLIAKGCKDDDVWPRKLKGITALEGYLGKKTFNDYVGYLTVKPAGKPTLAPISDKRPELNTAENAVDDFKELIQN